MKNIPTTTLKIGVNVLVTTVNKLRDPMMHIQSKANKMDIEAIEKERIPDTDIKPIRKHVTLNQNLNI